MIWNDCPICGKELLLTGRLFHCGANWLSSHYSVNAINYNDDFRIARHRIIRYQEQGLTVIDFSPLLIPTILPFNDFKNEEQILKTIERFTRLSMLE
jgi:hypothetical protein